MRVTLLDIPKQGLHHPFTSTGPTAKAAIGEALDGEVLRMDGILHLTREGKGLAAEVVGSVTVERPCDRCTAPVQFAISVETKLSYVPLAEAEVIDPEKPDDGLDLGFLEGDAIETDQILAEAFVLDAPNRVTCVGDVCLNALPLDEGTPSESPGHPAFAVLKKLL